MTGQADKGKKLEALGMAVRGNGGGPRVVGHRYVLPFLLYISSLRAAGPKLISLRTLQCRYIGNHQTWSGHSSMLCPTGEGENN